MGISTYAYSWPQINAIADVRNGYTSY